MVKKEIKDKDALLKHLSSNKFNWFKDGKNKSGDFKFKADCTYSTSYRETGTWIVIDERTFWLKNNKGVLWTLKFVDDFG